MSKKLAILAFILTASAGPALAQQVGRPAYLNPALPVDQRVDDLASRMTLDEKATQLSSTSAAIPRLQVPAYNWWSEALHGVANQGIATVFPQAIGLAATFNEPLVHQIATTISTEARAKYHEYEKYFKVIATPKHFAVHSGPEPSRHTIDVKVSLHDLEDTYLPAFRQTVTLGKAYSVMCAYNRINGEPA